MFRPLILGLKGAYLVGAAVSVIHPGQSLERRQHIVARFTIHSRHRMPDVVNLKANVYLLGRKIQNGDIRTFLDCIGNQLVDDWKPGRRQDVFQRFGAFQFRLASRDECDGRFLLI